MKRWFLAGALAVFVVVLALALPPMFGAAQSGPVPDARPTPTPELPLPELREPTPVPESPQIPPLPDLVVDRIELVPPSPIIGEPVLVRVVLHNQAAWDVEPGNNFWSDFYIDPGVVPIQLGQDGVAAWPCQATWVPAGGYHTLETEVVFDDVKVFSLWAQVDTDGHVIEANEHNNVFGPYNVQVLAANQVVHGTHQDFQMGLASTLDASHSEGVLRTGLFIEPSTEPGIYSPDTQVDSPPPPPPQDFKINVNQVKPSMASDDQGALFAVWEDGRNGSVFNRDIYFARSLDGGLTWSNDLRVNDDPLGDDANQVSPSLAYDLGRGRLYAVWQDERELTQQDTYDIYFAYSDDMGATWSPNVRLNDDTGIADQLNPTVVVGKAEAETDYHVYVVWQDRRNGNDDIYLTRSDDGGVTWTSNYFVTDDPEMTLQNQVAPSVSVEEVFGIVYVGWEDWRDPEHPEIYVMWSLDQGLTYGIDVPVTIVPASARTTYRRGPDLVAHTTIEWVERVDPVTGLPYLEPAAVIVVHVAWQEGLEDESDIYYAFSVYDVGNPEACPVPYDFCFEAPMLIGGYELPADYVRPPGEASTWPLEPSWQGEVSLDLVPDDMYWTNCLLASTEVYSKGVMIAWSDARSYDEWRHEIHLRRVASPGGNPKSYTVCDRPRDVGMVNSNAKIHALRDDLTLYRTYKPAAARQSNPQILVDGAGIFVVWDDDRWDDPTLAGVPNRDIFAAKMGATTEGAYVSPVIDALVGDPNWYVLSWWAATDHTADILFQTRFGTTLFPPQENVAQNGWTKWTGNPGAIYQEPPFNGCSAGVDCYYDAPGRHMVGPLGDDWFGPTNPGAYRYMQYKVIMNGSSYWTALGQVTIHYKGPGRSYLPIIRRGY
jgi:hypothetical protein